MDDPLGPEFRFLAEHMNTNKTVTTVVTPALARAILKLNHPTPDDPMPNRAVNANHVSRLADAMRAGEWALNGHTIAIAKNGRLNDGQHRLLAVVESDCEVPMDIRFGIERRAVATNDLNDRRQNGDWLTMLGMLRGKTLAATLRLYASYLDKDYDFAGSLTPRQAEAMVKRYPGMIEAARLGDVWYREFRHIPRSVWAFCYYVCAEIDKGGADYFFSAMATGAGIDDRNDPANVARRFFINQDRDAYRKQGPKIQIIFKAWNSFRRGQTRAVLRLRREGDRPEGFPSPI